MTSRRSFIHSAAGALLGATVVSRGSATSIPEAPTIDTPATQAPRTPTTGRPYHPVVTLNGWTLPWTMEGNVKAFHLIAQPVEREIGPGMTANLWGYNGQSPGPTIECVEGDRVRIYVTNALPEITTIHWHGVRVPNGMDGVAGLTQAPIRPGETWIYEFEIRHAGTYMYHPHADDLLQIAMGMMGFIVVHPRDVREHAVDRDYVFLINAYDIAPGSATPRVATMLDHNLWTWNSRAYPGIDALVARTGERVRVRMGNLTMTNHPIHLHGHAFEVTCTDGGWVRESARWPEVTVDIGVGQMRAIEFVADAPGDWAFHCHKSHHTMNAMAHDLPTLIGVDLGDAQKKLQRLIPQYMAMGSAGLAEMGDMHMPLPENTLPMMTGHGPHGPIAMGGMFTTFKVRDELGRDNYTDPGWYQPRTGTVARKVR